MSLWSSARGISSSSEESSLSFCLNCMAHYGSKKSVIIFRRYLLFRWHHIIVFLWVLQPFSVSCKRGQCEIYLSLTCRTWIVSLTWNSYSLLFLSAWVFCFFLASFILRCTNMNALCCSWSAILWLSSSANIRRGFIKVSRGNTKVSIVHKVIWRKRWWLIRMKSNGCQCLVKKIAPFLSNVCNFLSHYVTKNTMQSFHFTIALRTVVWRG